jgi:hypothetical protein
MGVCPQQGRIGDEAADRFGLSAWYRAPRQHGVERVTQIVDW